MILAVLACASLLYSTSFLEAKEKLTLDYELYSKGVNIATMRFTLSVDKDNYTVERHVETVGFASLFRKIDIKGKVEGKITKTGFMSKVYNTKNAGDRAYDTMTVWDDKGRITVTPKAGFTLSQQVRERLRKASADSKNMVTEELTSMFYFSKAKKENICKGSVRVFTGVRVYDHEYAKIQGLVKFSESSRRNYSGNGYICERKKINIAGYGDGNGKASKDGKEKIWLGEVVLDKQNFILLVQFQQERQRIGTIYGYLTKMTRHAN